MPTEEFINMDFESPVQASWFYMFDEDKTKLNWFIHEYACELYGCVKRSKVKALTTWKKPRNENQIAEFCAYFSKRMRQSILDKLAGKTAVAVCRLEYVCDYCHTIAPNENDAIIDMAEKAWGALMAICAVCPERCLAQPYERSVFFDRIKMI